MYVINNDSDSNSEFQSELARFYDSLDENNLIEEYLHVQSGNTRGADFNEIILKLIDLGSIGGLYALIKDFYDRYKNAEVVIKSGDNEIKIKNLTYEQAKAILLDNSEDE